MRRCIRDLRLTVFLIPALAISACSGSGSTSAPPASIALANSASTSPRPNVIFLTVDTLRADRLEVYGSVSTSTPHLDAMAAKSVRFKRAYAALPKTNPSLSTLMTGRYPSAHGVRRNGAHLPETEQTLAETLLAAGYDTHAFICNHVILARHGLAQGFVTYDQDLPDAIPTREAHERIAEHLVDAVFRWADASKPASPFFLWTHFIDPHGPYTPPNFTSTQARGGATLPVSETNDGVGSIPAYQALPGVVSVDEYTARYEGEVNYLDREIGRLLEGLRARGLLENTLLVMTADHGESLGDHNLFFQHGSSLYEAQLHVPLMILGPGISPRVVEAAVGIVDVMPTVLDRLGLSQPRGIQGSSLNAWLEGAEPGGASDRTLFAELGHMRAAIRGTLKLVWDGEKKDVDLFDVSADPAEEHDLAASRREDGRRLLEAVMRYSRENTNDAAPDDDEETKKALKSLGYVE